MTQACSRILIITRNLPPLVGGMERLNWHMADELAKQVEVQVIGPKGAAALKPPSIALTEAPLKPLPMFLLRISEHRDRPFRLIVTAHFANA